MTGVVIVTGVRVIIVLDVIIARVANAARTGVVDVATEVNRGEEVTIIELVLRAVLLCHHDMKVMERVQQMH